MIYCIVPRELAAELHDPLRRHFVADEGVEVVVERRFGDRRVGRDRRSAEAGSIRKDRRRVRNISGRRVGERRAPEVLVEALALPESAHPHLDKLVFVERVEPSDRHSEDLDTARLVVAVQSGDREAFATLYVRYFDRVYGYLRVALKDAAEAEDAAQHVFLKVLEAVPQYERRSQPFRAWLFRIVRNHAVDVLRKHGRTEAEDPAEIERMREPVEDERDLSALRWISDSEVLMLVERLPEAQRQVLVMRYMLDLSPAEIAEILNRRPESVRQIQKRALSFLRDRLSALGRDPLTRRPSMGMRRRPLRRLRGHRSSSITLLPRTRHR